MTSEVTLPPMNDAQKTERSGVDTCWHVPVICALAFVVISVGSENSGFFYLGFMEVFNTNRAAVTWPSTMISIMLNFAGVFVWLVQHWFSIFRIAQTSSVLCWISMIASTFAPSMPWMTVTFGVLYGTGLGVFFVSLGIIVVMFFERYMGIACGMTFMGHTVCSLLFSRILVLMQKKYGFRATFFLCGAIMMHATALAFLLKKPLWMIERPDAYWFRDNRETVLASNGQTHNALTPTVSLDYATSKKYKNMWRLLNTIRKPMFYVIVIYSAVAGYSKVSFQRTIVDYVMDKGSSLTEAESMVEYFSLSQLVGCLVIPLISDLRFVKRSTLIMINVILLGCTYVSLPHLTSFSYLVPACMLVALLLGSVTSFPMVLMADYLGIDEIPVCWTAVGVASLPLYLCSPMTIGLFRDSIGAYDNFYRFQAAIQFFVGVMLCLVCDSENDRTIPINYNTNPISTVTR